MKDYISMTSEVCIAKIALFVLLVAISDNFTTGINNKDNNNNINKQLKQAKAPEKCP